MPPPGLRVGSIASFDEKRGTGAISWAGGDDLFFHCTAVADGSRRVAPGARVAFLARPGRGGRWEAVAIQKI